jgi:hypothetical protein
MVIRRPNLRVIFAQLDTIASQSGFNIDLKPERLLLRRGHTRRAVFQACTKIAARQRDLSSNLRRRYFTIVYGLPVSILPCFTSPDEPDHDILREVITSSEHMGARLIWQLSDAGSNLHGRCPHARWLKRYPRKATLEPHVTLAGWLYALDVSCQDYSRNNRYNFGYGPETIYAALVEAQKSFRRHRFAS